MLRASSTASRSSALMSWPRKAAGSVTFVVFETS